MSESIENEYIAENTRMRQKLSSFINRDATSENPFIVLSQEPMMLTGIAISKGIWKGTLYDEDEIKKMLPKLKGLRIIAEHGGTEEFKTLQLGSVENLTWNEDLKAIIHKSAITNDKAKELIKNGTFKGVSLKGKFNDYDVIDGTEKGVDYTPIEMSLTQAPACHTCLNYNYEELSEYLNINTNTNLRGEKDMSELKPSEEPKEKAPECDSEFLELLPISQELKGSYVEFIKTCMKGGKDMKACATEWKTKHGEEEVKEKEYQEEYGYEDKKMTELAEVKCPVCDKPFKNFKEFKGHWEEKHGSKYGEYGKAKSMMKDLFEDRELRNRLKKYYYGIYGKPKKLAEEKPVETKTETPKTETKVETPAPVVVTPPTVPVPAPAPTPVIVEQPKPQIVTQPVEQPKQEEKLPPISELANPQNAASLILKGYRMKKEAEQIE